MICLNGTESVIVCDFFPPIDLSHGEWSIGLIDFTTYNSIPNVEENINNKIHLKNMTLGLATGSYEIEDINRLCQEKVKKTNGFQDSGKQ